MPITLHLQFDPNQKHQLDAIVSVLGLFEGITRQTAEFTLGDEIKPNLPEYENLSENWLFENLLNVQKKNYLPVTLINQLECDEGMGLEGVDDNSWRYPNFTVEMETGTGKTYVYLRTIYELSKNYGFSKFIIVVPSIAIYEGVIKNFDVTRDHLRALYSNETVNLTRYDGSKLNQLRGFASSSAVEVMVITLDSFNKASNVIYKVSEKLPGEKKPFEYIRATHPILILDEPQNMESAKSKEALRTLHPLFALRYSATHRTSPNLVYRLTPFDAYRMNLVKKIQVMGVTEQENYNQPFLALHEIKVNGGIKAVVHTYVQEKGRAMEKEIVLKQDDDLHEKTGRDEHKAGFKVININAAENFIEFENSLRLYLKEPIGPSRPEIFRQQIRSTIEEHMALQQKLERKKIKVLSLFFIDRVANYTARDGLIRRIFDEEFERGKRRYPYFSNMTTEEVRKAYFACMRAGKTVKENEQAIDTDSKNRAERDAEKSAFELIMRKKERLLSFEEKTCFIFTHSALKEGWDNPNVFQICTLNQTISEIKKRQEIGRGLRLAVDQSGARVFDENINVLTVVANESYSSYASHLQTEYEEDGLTAPPKPTNASREKVKRHDEIFNRTKAFRDFWAKLQEQITYQLHVDSDVLIQECIFRIENKPTPQAIVVVEKGNFVITDYSLDLDSVSEDSCRIRVIIKDILGNDSNELRTFNKKSELDKVLSVEALRGFKIVEIVENGESSFVKFGNGKILIKGEPIHFTTEKGQKLAERATMAPKESFPVFNLLDRAAKESGLTRASINKIFKGLSNLKKSSIFRNPEGFAGQFITEINNELANHIAERIEFLFESKPTAWRYDLEELFPSEQEFPQKELEEASERCLYDQVQVDSDVEKNFVKERLNVDGEVVFYFKFPPAFKIDFPRVIGNYNPDWGIARYGKDHKIVLELVRETKGQEEGMLDRLRFPGELRKINCAKKAFEALGVDFRVVSDQTVDWWVPASEIEKQGRLRT